MDQERRIDQLERDMRDNTRAIMQVSNTMTEIASEIRGMGEARKLLVERNTETHEELHDGLKEITQILHGDAKTTGLITTVDRLAQSDKRRDRATWMALSAIILILVKVGFDLMTKGTP